MSDEYEEEESRKFFGKYKGFVRDNVDPENRGRLRVFCPQVMGPNDSKDQWLGWAEPCHPWIGGISAGDFGPPYTKEQQVADFGSEWLGVWVEFEAGEPDFPVWVGTFNVAPLPDSASAHRLGVDGGSGIVGGGVIGSDLPTGSNVDALNPPRPLASREVRMRAPSGVDIVIGSEDGGYLILGTSGAHLMGAQLTLNGMPVHASSTKLSGG